METPNHSQWEPENGLRPAVSETAYSDSKLLKSGLLHQEQVNQARSPQTPQFCLDFAVEITSYTLLNLLGYGLLLLALLDYFYILWPLRLTDPHWEFQTIGRMVEQVPVVLIGLVLIFVRKADDQPISPLERWVLSLFSWLALGLGLLYLLMIPLGIADSWRIHHMAQTQVTQQLSQQRQSLHQVKTQVDAATTDEQIRSLIAAATLSRNAPTIDDPQGLKNQLLSQIDQAEQTLRTQAKTAQVNQKRSLLKNAVKWNLGALISGVLFIVTWRLTAWTRGPSY